MKYIEAVNELSQKDEENTKIFLGGGITNCEDWQKEVVDKLKDLNIVVLNPRRKNFPIENPDAAKEQITWEFNMLEKAEIATMWFSKGSMCPICLYELGKLSMTDKILIIGVDPEYSRKQDVIIQTGLIKPELTVYEGFDDFLENCYNIVKENIKNVSENVRIAKDLI